MSNFEGLVFAPGFSQDLGARIAGYLGVSPAAHEEREFDGGEHKIRSLTNVRGRDTYVVASLDGDGEYSANDKLCRLLFLIGALKEASARSVTAVVPYLCYSRKDRQTKARDPVTTRYVALLFEAVGTDRVVTLDVHNPAAFQNAFRCATDHLEATQPLVDHFRRKSDDRDIVVVSPDSGGVKRAERFRQRLSVGLGRPVDFAFTGKHRSEGTLSGSAAVLGQVDGRMAIVVDDMIVTGGTMRRVAEMLVRQGATDVHLVATHGVFTAGAESIFASRAVTTVVITDSVEPRHLASTLTEDRLIVVEIASLLGDAIARIDSGDSLADLLHLDQ